MPFHNVVVEFSFRLDGAKSVSFSVNEVKGHVCRAVLSTKGLSVRKDAPDTSDKCLVLSASTAYCATSPK